MKIPAVYVLSNEILSIIAKIDAQRLYFSSIKIPNELKNKIERQSLLKSSLYSARIEGNPLELADLEIKDGQEIKKREVFNIIDAARMIDVEVKKGNLHKSIISKLHNSILKDISGDAGKIRSEPSAIFNQAGVAVYLPPPPFRISNLLDVLFRYINSPKEKFPLITAFVSHLVFEKIHPFLDGNGRVGRLLISAILKAKGWEIVFTVPFEEYLDNNRSEYYFYLDIGMQKANEYLTFMLNAYLAQMESLKKQIELEMSKKGQFLSPRQEEMMNIIKDHAVVSFDMVRRRFLKVPERTLRYDFKKLVDKGLVETSGQTRGRYYRIKK